MKHPFLLFIAILWGFSVQGQTLNQAKVLYAKGEFQKALPVFQTALKKKPLDASLNLWYGVCLLETGKAESALTHLLVAEKKQIPEADRQLARYYLITFAPDSALNSINRYLENQRVSAANRPLGQALKAEIERFIDQHQRVEDICFIDSVIVPKSKLYSSIRISTESGNLAPVQTVFPDAPVSAGSAYYPERNDRIFYAMPFPGNGLDLVARHRILNDWGHPEPLSDAINTEANECNPFYLADGITLYFASDGQGSMGGYDLFVSRLNTATNTYLMPDHLNMPFNSKANDYFLILDEFARRGYLATDRNQKEGYVAIYTFIPNKTKVLLQGKSYKELLDFAQIRSIKATQVGKNMDSLLQTPSTKILKSKKEAPEFIFTINDSLHYSKESDFRSDNAREMYIQYKTTHQKYMDTKKTLEEKRAQYLVETPEMQKRLGVEILKLESEVLNAQRELPLLEKQVRNLEISRLSQ